MWLSIDVLEAIIETGVGHKHLLSIQWVFQVRLGEILDGWAFCYRRKAQNRAVSSSKVSFFTFLWSGRPILPHVCIAKSFIY